MAPKSDRDVYVLRAPGGRQASAPGCIRPAKPPSPNSASGGLPALARRSSGDASASSPDGAAAFAA